MKPTRIFLASHSPESIGFTRELENSPDYYSEDFFSRVNFGGRALFSAAAAEGECVIEWLAKTPSPLAGGARVARLQEGQMFRCDDTDYLVYAEPFDCVFAYDSDSPAESILTAFEGLGERRQRDALFCLMDLPYVSKGLNNDFVAHTGFVQLRDGRVPRVRHIHWERRDQSFVLRIEMEVYQLFTCEWDVPHLELERRLTEFDLGSALRCAALRRDLPEAALRQSGTRSRSRVRGL